MNIEKLREDAANSYAERWAFGQIHSNLGFKSGAIWEANRPKWVKVEDALPEREGDTYESVFVLARNYDGDIFDSRYDYKNNEWLYDPYPKEERSRVIEWCEIPK